MPFGENVRWARTRKGLTQAELADRIRVRRHPTTASYISRLEHGSIDPRLSTVRSIARALGVQVALLTTDLGATRPFYEEYAQLTSSQKREVRRMVRYMLGRYR